MKKTLLIFIISLFIFILCACGLSSISIPPMPTSTPVPKYTTVPTSTPEPTIIPAGLENRVIVRINDITNQAYDPEYGTIPILTFRYQVPIVLIDNNKESEDNINASIAELNRKYINDSSEVGLELDKYNELLSLAEGSYSSESDELQEFRFSRLVDILRADDNIVCLKFTNTLVQFGNESVTEEYHYYDSSSGNEIDESLVTTDAFPVAEKRDLGNLSIAEEINTDDVIVDLIEVDEDGTELLLRCYGIIYDLYIGNDWYCNVLANESVQLKTIIPDGMPELLISYSSGGDAYNYLLAKNLDTGKPELVDYDSVFAVG